MFKWVDIEEVKKVLSYETIQDAEQNITSYEDPYLMYDGNWNRNAEDVGREFERKGLTYGRDSIHHWDKGYDGDYYGLTLNRAFPRHLKWIKMPGFKNVSTTYDDGSTYKGDAYYFNGVWLPHGIGKLNYKNGYVYEGDFLDGKEYGYGILIWPDGDFFKGRWVEGRKNGEGTMYVKTKGIEIIGNWVYNKKQGVGQLKLEDGTIYKGVWKDDTLNGKTVSELYTENKEKYMEWVAQSKIMSYVELDKPITGTNPHYLFFNEQKEGKIDSKWVFPLEAPYSFRHLYHDLKPSDTFKDVYSRWECTTNKQHAIEGMVSSLQLHEIKELLKRFNAKPEVRVENVDLFINFIKGVLRINYWNLQESLILKTMEEKHMTRENAIKYINPYSNDFIVESLRTTLTEYIEFNPFGTIVNKKRKLTPPYTAATDLMNPFKKDEALRWDEFLLIIMFFIKSLPISNQLSWAETYITSFAEAYDLKKCTFPNKIVTFNKKEKEGESPACANGSFYHTLISLYYTLFDTHPGLILDEASLIKALRSEVITELQHYREINPFDVDEAKQTEL